MKVSEGRKAWVKNPEKLENCSTGFHFPQQDKESVKGQVIIISLPFFCFPLVCVLSVRVSDFKVSCVCVF